MRAPALPFQARTNVVPHTDTDDATFAATSAAVNNATLPVASEVIPVEVPSIVDATLNASEPLRLTLAPMQARNLTPPVYRLARSVDAPITVSAESERVAATSLPTYQPSYYVSFSPLFTFRRLAPMPTNDWHVSQVNTPSALSAGRIGWRLQVGTEMPLSDRWKLRAGLTYVQVQQQFSYTLRACQPDSIRSNVLDTRTVQLTPVYAERHKNIATTWHFTGLSMEMGYRLGTSRQSQHYVMLGGSVGRFLGPGLTMNGFVQASYSYERPLMPHVWLRIEPTMQYGISPRPDKYDFVNVTSYNYGMTFGLRFE